MDPDASTQSAWDQLGGLVGGVASTAGTDAADSALAEAQSQIPGLSYTAGQNATQAALDTLAPYLPWILIGVVAVALIA